MPVGAGDPVQENPAEFHQPLSQGLIFPNPVEPRISFKDMQMGVHRLGIVAVLVRKAHVGDRLPVPRASLKITALLDIQTVVFDAAPQLYRKFERFFLAGGAEILGAAVYCEGYRIKLLFRVERGTVRIQTPVDAAEFVVVELVTDLLEGASGRLPVFFLPEDAVGRRKGPQYPGVENCSLGRVRHQLAFAVHLPVETSGRIMHSPDPERENAAFKFFADFGPQGCHFIAHDTKINNNVFKPKF